MRPFTDVLRDINGGKFADELSEAMSDLVASCASTGKGGELVLKIKLKPAKGGNTVMTIDHDFKVKAPEFDRPQQFFFVAHGNTLVTENPQQRGLPFREVVDRETGEIKVVEDRPGQIKHVAA